MARAGAGAGGRGLLSVCGVCPVRVCVSPPVMRAGSRVTKRIVLLPVGPPLLHLCLQYSSSSSLQRLLLCLITPRPPQAELPPGLGFSLTIVFMGLRLQFSWQL